MCPINMQNCYFTLQELSWVWTVSWCLKKSNIVPFHEEGNKQLIKSYRPVSWKNSWKNLYSVPVTPGCINSFRLFMIFTMLLTPSLPEKLEAFSLLSPKYLIGCRIRVYYIKLNACVLMEFFETSQKHFEKEILACSS